MTTPKLILWDIDHTLIETGGVGSEVFRDAFEQVTGHKIEKLADVTGRTEPIIFQETLEIYGIEDPGDYFLRFVRAQAEGYQSRAEEMRRRGRVLPGAREALESLATGLDAYQTVLTGNPRPSAEAKLSIFDLATMLNGNTGAYGDDDAIRANLVDIARQRVYKQTGVTFTKKTTVIIGDSPSDVEAASKGGAQIIAVASGNTSAEDLRSAGATTVLYDLADTAAVREAVAGF
ncbi:haloacid dehalogenase-like hydrolase [Actinomadura sp. DC4]|uniref:HAD family hydrolase n=1 Tax=Actinomadura sp. DC4 TaxID=3055069 RepID=UPI0025B169E3|nr:haloacid dehalogenase-like hydrolase [Actinomadura sp. DC4]MDN3351805.1 haloacid dehalogenase-like hydrolase [Actinomadura sp. DC4]